MPPMSRSAWMKWRSSETLANQKVKAPATWDSSCRKIWEGKATRWPLNYGQTPYSMELGRYMYMDGSVLPVCQGYINFPNSYILYNQLRQTRVFFLKKVISYTPIQWYIQSNHISTSNEYPKPTICTLYISAFRNGSDDKSDHFPFYLKNSYSITFGLKFDNDNRTKTFYLFYLTKWS